jgi:hypothetical protein
MPQNGSSPNSVREIAAIIGTLLALYWQPDETPEVRQLLMQVWLEDLMEFGPAVVAESMREWRRGQKWRPTIAVFRALCRENQDLANFRRDRALPKPEPVAVEPWLADIWRDGGVEARREANRQQEESYARAAAWRAPQVPR